jgi:Family of unknown function (DUF6152)
MRNAVKSSFLGVAGLLTVAVPLLAHHGNAEYVGKQITIKGTVTAWIWTNPHTILKVDVPDAKGNVVHWICENNAPSTLVNFGYTPRTFKPGDLVTVVMDATAKTTPVGRVGWIVLPNGQVLMTDDRLRNNPQAGADGSQAQPANPKKKD